MRQSKRKQWVEDLKDKPPSMRKRINYKVYIAEPWPERVRKRDKV